MGTPAVAACDAAVTLTEWAVKLGSTFASFKYSLIQRTRVEAPTGLYGLRRLSQSVERSSDTGKQAVQSMQFSIQDTGKVCGFVKRRKDMERNAPVRCDLRGCERLN